MSKVTVLRRAGAPPLPSAVSLIPLPLPCQSSGFCFLLLNPRTGCGRAPPTKNVPPVVNRTRIRHVHCAICCFVHAPTWQVQTYGPRSATPNARRRLVRGGWDLTDRHDEAVRTFNAAKCSCWPQTSMNIWILICQCLSTERQGIGHIH